VSTGTNRLLGVTDEADDLGAMEKKRSQPKKKQGYVSIDWNSRREETVKKCTDWTACRSSSCPSFCAQSNPINHPDQDPTRNSSSST